jgi:deoxyribose-phosphate aldolase
MISPAAFIDHTLLKPTMTKPEILQLCEEAVEHGFAAVCVPPYFVPCAVDCLYGSDVRVCSVVGFPCGYSRSRQKVAETADLVAAGADEIDMVVQLGEVLAGQLEHTEREIAQVVAAARQAPVKVIVECCYLTSELLDAVTDRVVTAGAAFVKTSTGFGPNGATIEAVQRLVQRADSRIGVKAAGGIRSLEDCQNFIAAGATRIGTSSGVTILREWQHTRNASDSDV